jgi:hypothetical protein
VSNCAKCKAEMPQGRTWQFCTDCGRAWRQKYRNSPKGIAARRAEKVRYRKSETGKAARLRQQRRVYLNQPGKYWARQMANVAKRLGMIPERPCEKCGATELVEMHHHDYAKPLDVIWLCRDCHLDEHGRKPLPTTEAA